MNLGIAGMLLLILIAWLVYRVFGWDLVRCATCGDMLHERDAIEHGGDPVVYSHPGICTDRHAKVHADTYYKG